MYSALFRLLIPYINSGFSRGILRENVHSNKSQYIVIRQGAEHYAMIEKGSVVIMCNETSVVDYAILNKALLEASRCGLNPCIQALTDAGADVNTADQEGNTCLIKAAENDHLSSLEILIKSGADVNAKNAMERTALMKAARPGHNDCLCLLIQSGADVNICDKIKYTGLINAAFSGQSRCGRELLSAGADVNIKDRYDRTALWMVGYDGNKDILELLIAAGADVNTSCFGFTVLMKAAFGGHLECVNKLIKAGADVNFCNNMGETALTQAFVCGHLNCMKLLLKSGADVNTMPNARPTEIMRYPVNNHSALGRKIFLLLKTAGEQIDEEIIRFEKQSALSLKHLCRNKITSHLIGINPHKNLFGRIPLLELPVQLMDYLLYYVSLD